MGSAVGCGLDGDEVGATEGASEGIGVGLATGSLDGFAVVGDAEVGLKDGSKVGWTCGKGV